MPERESTSGLPRLTENILEQLEKIESEKRERRERNAASEDDVSSDNMSHDISSHDISSPEIISPDKIDSSDNISREKMSSPPVSHDNRSREEMSEETQMSDDNGSYDNISPDNMSQEQEMSHEKISQERVVSRDNMSPQRPFSRDILSYDDAKELQEVCEIVPFMLQRIVPFIIHQSISPQARLILSLIITVSMHQISPTIKLTQKKLAEATATTNRTALRLLHELDKKKWIEYSPDRKRNMDSEITCNLTYQRFIDYLGLPIKVCEIFEYLDKFNRENVDISYVMYVSYLNKENTNIHNKRNNTNNSGEKDSEFDENKTYLYFSEYIALERSIEYGLLKGFKEADLTETIMDSLIERCQKHNEKQSIPDSADEFQSIMTKSIYYVATRKNVQDPWKYLIRALKESWGKKDLKTDELETNKKEIELLSSIASDSNFIDGLGSNQLDDIHNRFPHILGEERISNKNVTAAREKFKKYFANVLDRGKQVLEYWNIHSRKPSDEI